ISLGVALVAGRKRVPKPAAGITALRTVMTGRLAPGRRRWWAKCWGTADEPRARVWHNRGMSSAAQPYPSVGSDLDAEDAKDALREQLRRIRLERPERQLQEAEEALADVVEGSAAVQAARCVGLYTSRP